MTHWYNLALLIFIFVIFGVNIGSAIEPTLFICTSNTGSSNWNNPSYGCVLDGHPSVTSATPNIWYGRDYNIVNPYAPNTPAFIYVNVNIGGIVVGSQLLVGVSWDGGATWSANQSANGNTPPNYDDASYVLNFTASTVWNISKTTNSNFIIRVSGLSSNSIDYAQANVSYYYPAPILTYPTNVSTVNGGNINFTWTGVAPPYRLVIGDGSISNEVINTSVSGLYSLQSLSVNKIYYWKVANSDGNYSSVYSFETLLTLFTPANASTILKSFPPLTADVNFTWAGGFDKYNIVVAKDANFNLISVDKTISNNYSLEPLEAGNYWWKVRPYNETTVSYGNYSDTFNFTLSNQQTTTGTGIQGIIYELVDGVQIPISGATVTITNNTATWTNTQIVGSNGYYLFTDLSNSTTYQIKASRQDIYTDSIIYYVTTGLGTVTTQNILLQRCVSGFNCFYNQHYVKFTVQNIWFTKYANVVATVYKGSDLTASDTKTTGTDGSVNLLLIKDVMYRITFINATAGISVTWTGYPSKTDYYIITDSSTGSWDMHDSDASENINISISTNIVGSIGYINASYSDALEQTNGLIFYLNKTIPGDANNQSNLQTINAGANNAYNASFTLSDYSGQSYIVTARINHGTYGVIRYSYGVAFPALPGPLSNFNSTIILMLFVGLVLFVAGMFGQTSHVQGMAIVCGLVWILAGIGIFSNVNAGAGFYLALSLATVISIIANINERGKHEALQ